MKATKPLYFVIQRSQVHSIFVFYLFHCNPKEKDSKKQFIMRNQYYYYFDRQKLGSIGPVQQKINLFSPKNKITVEIQSTCIAKQTKPELTRTFT